MWANSGDIAGGENATPSLWPCIQIQDNDYKIWVVTTIDSKRLSVQLGRTKRFHPACARVHPPPPPRKKTGSTMPPAICTSTICQ